MNLEPMTMQQWLEAIAKAERMLESSPENPVAERFALRAARACPVPASEAIGVSDHLLIHNALVAKALREIIAR